MSAGLSSLTHEQQQKAVERIQEPMAQGTSNGQTIALVAEELRINHSSRRIMAHFEDEDKQHTYPYRFRYRGRWLFDCEKRNASRMWLKVS